MKELVSVAWLHQNLGKEDLVLLDTSLNTTSEFNDLTIPTSRYFDLKGNFSDRRSDLPNTIPSEAQFELECQKLGIDQNSHLVVFDNQGIYSSPRVWWMFKVMGHERVSVLDGGLTQWIKQGHYAAKRKKQSHKHGNFQASLNKSFIVKYPDILKNIEDRTFTLIDARSEGRFKGTEAEPRKPLKSGHIEGSINIPFKEVLNNTQYKSTEELRRLFQEKCGTENKLVFSCGSGLTACIVLLASEIAFKKSRYVYDGSWTEWAEKNNLKA